MLPSLTIEKLFHSVPLPEQKIAAMTCKCDKEIQMYCEGCVRYGQQDKQLDKLRPLQTDKSSVLTYKKVCVNPQLRALCI